MKLKRNCRAVSLRRALPLCALLLAAAFACLALGGSRFFSLFSANITPVVLPWRTPADTTAAVDAAFVFEAYSTVTLTGGPGEEDQTRREYLMTTDWQHYMAVSFTLEDLAVYGPLIEEMHTAAQDEAEATPLRLAGLWADLDAAAQADFDALIESMGYSPEDAAISHRVLLVNQKPFITLSPAALALFAAACLLCLAGLCLLLFTLLGGFQAGLGRRLRFGKGARKNKVEYSAWKTRTVKCGDLYLNPELLIFPRGLRTVCLNPEQLNAVRMEKGRYVRLFPTGGRPCRVWVEKQHAGFVRSYFFETFPTVSVD